MLFFIYGGIAGLITFFCFSFGKMDKVPSAIIAVILGTIFGFLGWLTMPSLGFFYAGNWLLLGLLGFIIFVVSAIRTFEDRTPLFVPSIPLILSLIVGVVIAIPTTSGIFNAERHHALLGDPVESVFTEDVSPVDITSVRRVDRALAITLGEKRIEEQPGLGSRVNLESMNIQSVNGCFMIREGNGTEQELCLENELVWVGPLSHEGFFSAVNNDTTPGYIMVNATNPSQVYLVTAIGDNSETSTPTDNTRMGQASSAEGLVDLELDYLNHGGYFSNNVYRWARLNGYTGGITDISFEINNAGRPYWVLTQYEPTIGFGGADAIGVVVIDAQTGNITDYTVAEAPTWIDRIQPEAFVTRQLNNWGGYVNGFWNTIFGRHDMVQVTPGMSLVYGADGQSYWYSGMQSAGSDQATNSFVLVNTRTKEVRRYMVAGANETAARHSAEGAPGVREADYVGTDPILYNVSGEPTYFLTLKDGSGLVKMFAFVSVRNYETVGVGESPAEALRAYQNALIREGQNLNIDDIASQERIVAVVSDSIQIDDTFYLLLEGQDNREFYGTSDVSPELKWARPGRTVVIVAQASELESVQIFEFDIPDLEISSLDD